MPEKSRVPFSCPNCDSETFVFITEPHTINNVESCATCGREISNDEISEHRRQVALDQLNKVVRDAFE